MENPQEEDIFDKIFEKNSLLVKVNNPDLIEKIFENPKLIPEKVLKSRIKKLTNKLIENRKFIEFFSKINGKSIYLILFEILFSEKENEELINLIYKLIHELSFHIELNKEIFEYLIEKLSRIIRKVEKPNPKILNTALKILNELFFTCEEYCPNPKNYFYYTGNGNFTVDLKNSKYNKLMMGYGITLIINFKVGLKEPEFKENYISNILTINFDNNQKISIDLKYPYFLTVEGINQNPYRIIDCEEWNNMIINLGFDNKKKNCISIFVNGENSININAFNKNIFSSNSEITNLSFYDKFIGETTSIILLSQSENGISGIFDNNFLSYFKNNYEGIWKRRKCENFFKIIKEISSIKGKKNNDPKKQNRSLTDELKFIFTPFNCLETKRPINLNSKNEVEDVLSNYIGYYNGIVINHKYHCYQKKINLIFGIENLFPIAEIFLTMKETLTEENLILYFSLFKKILKGRKKNLISANQNKCFQILSLFFEKYPNNFFTKKIIEEISEIGKLLLIENNDELTSSFFENIYLNEKIISKFSQPSQIILWDNIILCLFSDSSEIGKIFNIKKMCIILRYYDERRYDKFCCKIHYSQFKEDYSREKYILNPSMPQRLLKMNKIFDFIFSNQEIESIIDLFKLLTMDISPCLTKFILKIFIKAFEKDIFLEYQKKVSEIKNQSSNSDLNYLDNLKKNIDNERERLSLIIKGLESCNYYQILIGVFKKGLFDIRLDIIKLFFFIYTNYFTITGNKPNISFIEMLRNNLLPGEIFYSTNKFLDKNEKEINELAFHCIKKLKGEKDISLCNNFNDKILVLNEVEYESYKVSLYNSLFFWSIKDYENVFKEESIENIKLENKTILNIDIFQLVFYFCDELNNVNFTSSFIKTLTVLTLNDNNNKIMLNSDFICCWILDKMFDNYLINEEMNKNIFRESKNFFIKIFINSLIKCSKDENPGIKLENLLIWGLKRRNNQNEKKVFQLIREILNDIHEQIFSLEESEIFKNKKKLVEMNIDNNSFLRNYLFFVSIVFQFSFIYKSEKDIQRSKDVFLNELDNKIYLPTLFCVSMNLNEKPQTKNVENLWKDFNLFYSSYQIFNYIFSKENIYKANPMVLKNKNQNQDFYSKYESILNYVILNKERKNAYISDLKFLCYKIKNDENHMRMIPLLSIIPIQLTSIITLLTDGPENEYIKYLREYKRFIKYIIIASSNAYIKTQETSYNYIMDKCLQTISYGLCFFEQISKITKVKKEETNKCVNHLMTLCLLICKHQYQYMEKGQILKTILNKITRNNLSLSSVFKLFSNYIIDNNGKTILDYDKIKQLAVSHFSTINSILEKPEMQNYLICNDKIRISLRNNYFFLNFLYNTSVSRYEMKDKIYKICIFDIEKDICNIIPDYVAELEKYSNSSYESQKEKKSKYQKLKKKMFSWNGLCSDKDLFYKNVNRLKLKMVNHYTKNLMKPLLMPILDLDYYIPNFTHYNVNEMFMDDSMKNKKDKINLDIDEILNNEQNSNLDNEKEISPCDNYFRYIYRYSNNELAKNYLLIQKSLDSGKDNDDYRNSRKNKSQNKDENKNYYLCCIVKTSHHIKGVISIENKDNNNFISFKVFSNQKFENNKSDFAFSVKGNSDYDPDRKSCYGSYFTFHKKNKDLSHININISNLKFIFRRRYYYKNSGLEIFTNNHKSYYLNFKVEKERENFISELLTLIPDNSKLINDMKEKDQFDNIIGYLNNEKIRQENRRKKFKLSQKVKEWTNWEVSNLELLMLLNLFSNRSLNDISQYPVFPWILSNYKDPLKNEYFEGNLIYSYRDLSLPLGMLEISEESISRKENFIEIYNSMKTDQEENINESMMKPYVYGTHYSCPIYVCNFLMRLFPFSNIMIELNGYRFDQPDRLFLSVQKSFNNSTSQKTDLRELVPEFFYLPEIFRNINNFNLGQLENGEIVNDIFTPCDNDPYEFVILMRSLLENEDVSLNLKNWIDLIFGYKNRGKDADLAFNVFSEASYEDKINLNNYDDRSVILRLVEFGLTPEQIYIKEFPQRNKKFFVLKGSEITDEYSDIKIFKCKNKQDLNLFSSFIIKAKVFDQCNLYLLTNDTQYLQKKINYSIMDRNFSSDTKINKNLENKIINQMRKFFSKESDKNNNICIFNKGKSIIIGGFFDGKILTITYDTKFQYNTLFPFNDEIPITSIEITQNEDFAICGNLIGNIAVYSISFEKEFKLINLFSNNNSEIVHINSNDNLNLFVIGTLNGFINIYTLPDCKLIRSLKLDINNCTNVFLSSNPIPCVIVVNSLENETELYSYSINGHFLKKQNTNSNIKCPLIMKDLSQSEFFVYINENEINIRTIPSFFMQVQIDLNAYFTNDNDSIKFICVSEDMKQLFALNSNGNNILVIKGKTEDYVPRSNTVVNPRTHTLSRTSIA